MVRRTYTAATTTTAQPMTPSAPTTPKTATLPSRLSARRSGRKAAERGASLVEIMVVLVILLIGVFLAIRIFPVGFGTLRANENRTAATRLAERLLSLAKGDAAENLPEGVLSAYVDTDSSSSTYNQLVVNTDQDPDDLTPYIDPNDTTKTPNLFFSDANRFHFIKGEQVKVPLPTATSNGTGSVYTVKFGPIYMDQTVGTRANAPASGTQATYDSYLKVTGAPMLAIPAEAYNSSSSTAGTLPPDIPNGSGGGSDATPLLQGPQSYLVDYGDDNTTAYILFAPRAPTTPSRATPYRTFTVTCNYLSGQTIVPVSVTIQVPDATTALWQAIPTTTGGTTYAKDLIPASVTAQRDFQRIAFGATWDTSDPYQYQLALDNFSPNGVMTYANTGALLFNPAGANYTETTAYGERAFTAYIDYAVLNWHIIHDDIEVPTTTPDANGLVSVRLAVAPIKEAGDSTTDANGNPVVYNNLFNDPNPADSIDIVAYDVSDNKAISAIGNFRTPNASDVILTDEDPRGGSYRTGTIYINTNNIKPGSTIRIMYQAEGDYAVSLQKAYSQYICPLVNNAAQTRPPAGAYDQFGIDTSKGIVVFPGSDLNKSVSLSIEYQLPSGEWKRLDAVQVTLDSLYTEAGTDIHGNATTRRYATAAIANYVPSSLQTEFSGAQTWRVAGANGVGTAQGTSVKARVIWHDADISSNRWRVHDLDSNLTPSP